MSHANRVKDRNLDRAESAGRRWQGLLSRRAEAVRLLKLGGPRLADRPERVEQYLARESAKRMAYARAGVTDAFFSERRIGPTLDLDEYPPNDAARIAGVPVGRIVELDDRGGAKEGFATGFLIAPNLMITNHHVFADASECRGCGIQFGYEKVEGALSAGVVFGLDTNYFFFTQEDLDFAVVGVSATPTSGRGDLRQFRSLTLIPTTGKILVGQPISIIQYPDGGPKKYGVRDNELLIAPADTDKFLEYTTDTLPGSSGSPAFNKDWEIVGLHHSGVPEIKNGAILTIQGTPWKKGMPDSDIHWIANEGARVSLICAALAAARVPPAHQGALASLVATFGEDFSKLPALQGRAEAVAPANAISQLDDRNVSITVNGNASFYFGGAPAAALEPPAARPAMAPAVVVEKKLRFDPRYDRRPGYDPDFLGVSVPLPGVVWARAGELLTEAGAALVLAYHHYSLAMNRVRRLQMWSAVNVDYTPSKRRKKREDFGTDTWVPDPRIAAKLQIEDQELYNPAAKFDRGHIVRRDDTAWGDTAEEEIFANSDSFHWTNCTPQHEQFNRDVFGFRGLWGQLENHIQSQAQNVGQKMSILAGPVLDDVHDIDHDFGGGPVKIPRRFWKILCVAEDSGTAAPTLRAYGFVLDQSQAIQKYGIERFSVGEFDTYQVRLDDITQDTGVTFAGSIRNADAMLGAPNESRRLRIESLANVRL